MGLQRGGIGILGDWFPPGCDPVWGPLVEFHPNGSITIHPGNAPSPLPCLIADEDPITDTMCGHGPDRLIV